LSLPSPAAWLAGLLALAACSPTFNWRDWPVQGTPLRATMPCKPESASRPVPMLGTPVELHMHSCETGGMRFALAWADVGGASQVPVALAAWRAASLQTLRLTKLSPDDPALAWPVKVPGAPQAEGVQAEGTDPQGQVVRSRAVYFARGTQVFQAAVYGARLNEAALEAFFGGLALPNP
jgi:hypothetical protein